MLEEVKLHHYTFFSHVLLNYGQIQATSTMGIPMVANGIDIKMLTSADLRKAGIKLGTKPRFIATIIKAIGTEIMMAARHDMTIP